MCSTGSRAGFIPAAGFICRGWKKSTRCVQKLTGSVGTNGKSGDVENFARMLFVRAGFCAARIAVQQNTRERKRRRTNDRFENL
jgi:hypothetical protein